MENGKKKFDLATANTAVGLIGGTLGIGLTIYQLVTLVRQTKAMRKQIEEQEEDSEN